MPTSLKATCPQPLDPHHVTPALPTGLLQGCSLPEAWRSQAQWRILATHWGDGAAFLHTWRIWKADPTRPQRLHYCAIVASPVSAEELSNTTGLPPELAQLAVTLSMQWAGLTPGFHRISLENGCVLLTVCIGGIKATLNELAFTADSLFLGHDGAATAPPAWDVYTLKALARRCARGTRFALRDTPVAVLAARANLASCGFVEDTPAATVQHGASGVFSPHWEPKQRHPPRHAAQAHCAVVIGGGLAGAAVAHSLARRGWQVRVLDSHPRPAQGASGLPAGLLVPLVSPDDNVPSRLSRSGLRITLQQAKALLAEGVDWRPTGVLERLPQGGRKLPSTPDAQYWSHPADAEQRQWAGLALHSPALWHPQAAWVKPAALVNALLAHPSITWQGDCAVADMRQRDGVWQVLDHHGKTQAEAALVVVCAALGSAALLADEAAPPDGRTVAYPMLQGVRGQISWGRGVHPSLPPFPINGHGSLIPGLSDETGPFWALGSTYERDQTQVHTSMQEVAARHSDNLERLRVLLPHVAQTLAPTLQGDACNAFIGIRCVTPDRLPLVGRWPGRSGNDVAAPTQGHSLWVSTAMGSRGLTFALLCSELLAAQLHDEPWPVERSLARAMDSQRLR